MLGSVPGGGRTPLLEAVFEDPVSFVGVLEPDGTLLRANETALEFAGVTNEDVAGQPFWQTPWWRHSAPLQRDLESYVERAAEGEFVRFEAENRGADGDRVTLDVSLRPVVDDEVIGVVAEGRDVTERVAIRDELEATKEKMAALHEVATELEGCESERTVYDRTVEAGADILDLYLSYVGVADGNRLVPVAASDETPDAAMTERSIDEGLAGKSLETGESYLVERADRHDDAKPVVESFRSGLSIPIGGDAVFQAVSTDYGGFDEQDLELAETLVSHAAESVSRIRNERRLQERNERLEQFAEVIAHDLRNPLTVLGGNLELARETGADEHFESAEAAADRMESLLSDLLQLARSGEDVSDVEPLGLGDVARDAWDGIESRDASLTVTDRATVRADRSRLRELFENCFRNAVEHAGPAVALTVGTVDGAAASTDAGHAASASPGGFYVADDGPGIREEDREAVFAHGYTTNEAGTGFGLSIVRTIADAHGWTATVTESERGGARFEFTDVALESD